jgi:hypothetical protein
MCKRLHPTKVLAIQSMLLETNDMYAISKALDVSYNAVAYYMRKMDRVELNGGIELTQPISCIRIIGLEFVDVCILLDESLYIVLYTNLLL